MCSRMVGVAFPAPYDSLLSHLWPDSGESFQLHHPHLLSGSGECFRSHPSSPVAGPGWGAVGGAVPFAPIHLEGCRQAPPLKGITVTLFNPAFLVLI